MTAINWNGMTPEDIFESLVSAPRVVRWNDSGGMALDPKGFAVAIVVGEGNDLADALNPGSPRCGFYVSARVAEEQLLADGYIIVNPRTSGAL